MSFKDAAYAVLIESRKPLHYVDITRIILERGLVETLGRTPERTLNTDISKDIKALGERSRFIRIAKGVYDTNPTFKNSKEQTRNPQGSSLLLTGDREEHQISVATDSNQNSNLYVGKAGEHAVASELLFRDYNISMMSVDEGIDIIASKKDKTYNIQVKTSHENQFKRYVSDIRISSFEKHNTSNTFYIFVLKSEEKGANFLIFPYYKIKELVETNVIKSVQSNTRYRVNMFRENSRILLANQNTDVTYFYNNWALIT
jgi:Holliday junction resolvase-like predicted endonuclease